MNLAGTTTTTRKLCTLCKQNRIIQQTGTNIVIPKRFRYYWEERPQCRERKRLMMITVPRLKQRTDDIVTWKNRDPDSSNLYGLDILLHKEVQEIFNTCRMIAVCLYADQINDDFYYVRYDLQQNGMSMEKYEKHILEFTLKDTPYEAFLTLCDGDVAVIFGEPNVAKMITALKKNKHLLLVGGLIDGKYMSVPELTTYSTLTLDGCRSELSRILSSSLSSTRDLLQRPSSDLSSALTQHVKQNDEELLPNKAPNEV